MKPDFEMIVQKLPSELDYINVYPLGDLHIGSPEFDQEQWDKWKKIVSEDERGYIVLIGDLMDNGLRNSKTNVYDATMRPHDQKKYLERELRPMAHKILGGVQGNHEHRSNIETDECPMYDVMAKLDVEDYYRQNMAFIKVSLGAKNAERQWSYNIVLGHGGSRTKTEKFSYAIDGMDVLFTGHTHQGTSEFPSKIVIDPRNNNVYTSGYVHITVPAFLKSGGYGLRNMYMPRDNKRIPMITLHGDQKHVGVRWL